MALVFCYGTLKRGWGNHHLLSESRFVSAATTWDRWRMHHCGFPVVMTGDIGFVRGEVYEVDAATLAELDRLEGNGYMYDRQLVEVVNDDDESMRVWMYVGRPEFWHQRLGPEITPDYYDCLMWRGRRYLEKETENDEEVSTDVGG